MKLADCPIRLVRDGRNVDAGDTLPIVRGIPLANDRMPRGVLRRTLRRREMGDSILVKRGTTNKAYAIAKELRIGITASHKGIDGGMCRIWRTA